MQVTFKSNKLKKSMSDLPALVKTYGDRANRLAMRLSVIHEAESLADVPAVPPERCHPLTGEWDGCFAVDVTANYRLIIEPNHNPVPRNTSGALDLKAITAVRILAVEDYH